RLGHQGDAVVALAGQAFEFEFRDHGDLQLSCWGSSGASNSFGFERRFGELRSSRCGAPAGVPRVRPLQARFTSQRAGLRQGHAPWAAAPSGEMTLREEHMRLSVAKGRGDQALAPPTRRVAFVLHTHGAPGGPMKVAPPLATRTFIHPPAAVIFGAKGFPSC
ncbi:MAG: hypothetical protein KA826_05220, partial [Ottowia sp.]|nr:hypothetical protein [Ottowia sp.]